MRSLIIIWILVLITIVGGSWYMINTINGMIQEMPEAHTSALTPQTSLEVVYNYSEQKTASIHVLEPKVSDVYLQYGSNTQTLSSANVLQGSSNIIVE